MRHRKGFSLIEVNLAVLMVAVGLLALFSLFPYGLRENEMAIQDTQEAIFAEHVLNGIEANAQDILDWDTWREDGTFSSTVRQGIYPVSGATAVTAVGSGAEFPNAEGKPEGYIARKMRYELTIGAAETGVDGRISRKRPITLRVRSGIYGSFSDARTYFSELFYMGM